MIVEMNRGETISDYFERLMQLKIESKEEVQGNVKGLTVSTKGYNTAIQMIADFQKQLDECFQGYARPKDGSEQAYLDLICEDDEIEWDNPKDVREWLTTDCVSVVNNPRYAKLLRDGKKPARIICEKLEEHGYNVLKSESEDNKVISDFYSDLKRNGYALSSLLGGDTSSIDTLVSDPKYALTEEQIREDNIYIAPQEEEYVESFEKTEGPKVEEEKEEPIEEKEIEPPEELIDDITTKYPGIKITGLFKSIQNKIQLHKESRRAKIVEEEKEEEANEQLEQEENQEQKVEHNPLFSEKKEEVSQTKQNSRPSLFRDLSSERKKEKENASMSIEKFYQIAANSVRARGVESIQMLKTYGDSVRQFADLFPDNISNAIAGDYNNHARAILGKEPKDSRTDIDPDDFYDRIADFMIAKNSDSQEEIDEVQEEVDWVLAQLPEKLATELKVDLLEHSQQLERSNLINNLDIPFMEVEKTKTLGKMENSNGQSQKKNEQNSSVNMNSVNAGAGVQESVEKAGEGSQEQTVAPEKTETETVTTDAGVKETIEEKDQVEEGSQEQTVTPEKTETKTVTTDAGVKEAIEEKGESKSDSEKVEKESVNNNDSANEQKQEPMTEQEQKKAIINESKKMTVLNNRFNLENRLSVEELKTYRDLTEEAVRLKKEETQKDEEVSKIKQQIDDLKKEQEDVRKTVIETTTTTLQDAEITPEEKEATVNQLRTIWSKYNSSSIENKITRPTFERTYFETPIFVVNTAAENEAIRTLEEIVTKKQEEPVTEEEIGKFRNAIDKVKNTPLNEYDDKEIEYFVSTTGKEKSQYESIYLDKLEKALDKLETYYRSTHPEEKEDFERNQAREIIESSVALPQPPQIDFSAFASIEGRVDSQEETKVKDAIASLIIQPFDKKDIARFEREVQNLKENSEQYSLKRMNVKEYEEIAQKYRTYTQDLQNYAKQKYEYDKQLEVYEQKEGKPTFGEKFLATVPGKVNSEQEANAITIFQTLRGQETITKENLEAFESAINEVKNQPGESIYANDLTQALNEYKVYYIRTHEEELQKFKQEHEPKIPESPYPREAIFNIMSRTLFSLDELKVRQAASNLMSPSIKKDNLANLEATIEELKAKSGENPSPYLSQFETILQQYQTYFEAQEKYKNGALEFDKKVADLERKIGEYQIATINTNSQINMRNMENLINTVSGVVQAKDKGTLDEQKVKLAELKGQISSSALTREEKDFVMSTVDHMLAIAEGREKESVVAQSYDKEKEAKLTTEIEKAEENLKKAEEEAASYKKQRKEIQKELSAMNKKPVIETKTTNTLAIEDKQSVVTQPDEKKEEKTQQEELPSSEDETVQEQTNNNGDTQPNEKKEEKKEQTEISISEQINQTRRSKVMSDKLNNNTNLFTKACMGFHHALEVMKNKNNRALITGGVVAIGALAFATTIPVAAVTLGSLIAMNKKGKKEKEQRDKVDPADRWENSDKVIPNKYYAIDNDNSFKQLNDYGDVMIAIAAKKAIGVAYEEDGKIKKGEFKSKALKEYLEANNNELPISFEGYERVDSRFAEDTMERGKR